MIRAFRTLGTPHPESGGGGGAVSFFQSTIVIVSETVGIKTIY